MTLHTIIMTAFLDEINGVEITTLNATFRMLASLVLGSLIGMERKRKGQIAGIRTFALISMGATLAMLLSIYVPQEYLGLKNGDPGRIAAQVITGIGFLGAGAIIQMKGSVRGLTTAAGIWMVATIGMAVGVGMYVVACVATALVLFILFILENFERSIHVGSESRTVRIRLRGIVTDIEPYRELLHHSHVTLGKYYVEYDYEEDITCLNLAVLLPEHTDLLRLFESLSKLNTTLSISLANQAAIS